MNLRSFKVFCDIVARRSFSRAASENGISQSAASQLVHQLEKHLGVKLIDRSKRPFILTPEGEVYFRGCRKIVERYAALEEDVRTHHSEVAGRVRVAAIYSVGLSHMNQHLADFLALHPKANVRLEYQHPGMVLERVETDQVDLGLVSYGKSTRTTKAIPWREEPMVLVCSPKHRLAERDEIELGELDGMAMVGFDTNLRIRNEIDRRLASHHAAVEIAMEFDNIETIKRAVEINAGVTLLPEQSVLHEVELGRLAIVRLAGVDWVRPLHIVHRRGKELGRTARRFIEMLHENASLPTSSE